MKHLFKIYTYLIFLILIFGCEENSVQPGKKTFVVYENDKIYIEDHLHKRWDITHAVNNLGFNPIKFRHGIGQNAIPPILSPKFYNPGDSDYPEANDALIIGYSSGNTRRAYPLNILVNHEVANDWYGGIPVAVAY